MTNLGSTVDVRAFAPGRARLWRFIGPASLISVGYMDPGNWATDLEGGARFGYQHRVDDAGLCQAYEFTAARVQADARCW